MSTTSATAQFGSGGIGGNKRSGCTDRARSDSQKINQDHRDVEIATKSLLQSLNSTQKAIADMRPPTVVELRPIMPLPKP